jgi:hypothetical protein
MENINAPKNFSQKTVRLCGKNWSRRMMTQRRRGAQFILLS